MKARRSRPKLSDGENEEWMIKTGPTSIHHTDTHVYVDGGIEHDRGAVNGSSHDGAGCKGARVDNISANKTDPGSTRGAALDGEEFSKYRTICIRRRRRSCD